VTEIERLRAWWKVVARDLEMQRRMVEQTKFGPQVYINLKPSDPRALNGGSIIKLSDLVNAEVSLGEPCSGVTASWCPVHGECACDDRDDAAARTFEDPACPLHAHLSTHANERAERDPVITKVLAELAEAPFEVLSDAIDSWDADTRDRLRNALSGLR
jgi:hypothetical protein